MSNICAHFLVKRPDFTLNVELQLPGNGVTALFGHSGAGKTTLLRCIAGLEQNQCGFLSINGEIWQTENHSVPTYKRSLGYVFQEASLFPHLTVLGNLRYGMKRVKGLNSADLEQAIDLLGIEQFLQRKPDSLSGGERQRVAIARALVIKPKILLMDEPLASLDNQRKREILPYLEHLHDQLKIPILYVSHSANEVARLADHLVVLSTGQVVANGSLATTLTQLDLPINLGEDVGAVLTAKIGVIDKHWALARADFSGGSLWTRDHNFNLGSNIRVRVLARDVSIAVKHPGPSSIQNILSGQVDTIANDEHPGLALVRVQVGKVMLLARLTKRAATDLDLSIGQTVWVMVKSVALVE